MEVHTKFETLPPPQRESALRALLSVALSSVRTESITHLVQFLALTKSKLSLTRRSLYIEILPNNYSTKQLKTSTIFIMIICSFILFLRYTQFIPRIALFRRTSRTWTHCNTNDKDHYNIYYPITFTWFIVHNIIPSFFCQCSVINYKNHGLTSIAAALSAIQSQQKFIINFYVYGEYTGSDHTLCPKHWKPRFGR